MTATEALIMYLGLPMALAGVMTGAVRSLRSRAAGREGEAPTYGPKDWSPLSLFDWLADIVVGGLVGFMWAALVAAFVIGILAKMGVDVFPR